MYSDDLAIKVTNLGKCYNIYGKPVDRLKQSIMPRISKILGKPLHTYYREFWALRDVSFEIKKGETVGIIGRNGSGKSTLLQMICGTLTPTYGTLETHGRIAALLELGSGFNPEFTGRENIYLNATILGFDKREIDERYDAIASFADIGNFLEQPIKTFSSGMVVRLAFAVNIMSNPEIMVVDEALAVGDMAFQAKCMTALKRIQENGATVLFVSHDVGAVKSLCDRGMYLEQGFLRSIGKASDVAEMYTRIMREEINTEQHKHSFPDLISSPNKIDKKKTDSKLRYDVVFKHSDEFDKRVELFRYGSGGARINFVELLDENDKPVSSVEFNQPVKIRIYFNGVMDIEQLSANYYIQDTKKNLILGAGLRATGGSLLDCKAGDRYIVTYSTQLPLQEGNYSIQIQLTKPIVIDQTAEFLDVIDDALIFNVQRKPNGQLWAKVYLPNIVDIIKKA